MYPIAHLAVTNLAHNNPIASLIWGNISHWIIDETCSEYRPMNVLMIIYEAIIAISFLLYTKCWWCVLGLLPDVIEAGYVAIKGIEVWNSGELLFWFHKYHGEAIWSFKKTVMVEVILLIIAMLIRR